MTEGPIIDSPEWDVVRTDIEDISGADKEIVDRTRTTLLGFNFGQFFITDPSRVAEIFDLYYGTNLHYITMPVGSGIRPEYPLKVLRVGLSSANSTLSQIPPERKRPIIGDRNYSDAWLVLERRMAASEATILKDDLLIEMTQEIAKEGMLRAGASWGPELQRFASHYFPEKEPPYAQALFRRSKAFGLI